MKSDGHGLNVRYSWCLFSRRLPFDILMCLNDNSRLCFELISWTLCLCRYFARISLRRGRMMDYVRMKSRCVIERQGKREKIFDISSIKHSSEACLSETQTHTHTSTLAQQSMNPSLFDNSILFPFEYNSSCVFPFHCFGFVFGNFGRDHDFCVQSHLHRNWHAI